MFPLFRRAEPALPQTLIVGGRTVPLQVARDARTRRLLLRADATRGLLRITVPPRARLAEVQALLDGHSAWIATQVARWPQPQPLVPGGRVPFDGGSLRLDWQPERVRGVVRDGDCLCIGGSAATLPGRVRRWLSTAALADLDPATHALAAQIGRRLTQVTVRDPATRWGSCIGGAAPRIGYSWRLIMAPAWVRHSVVAHEVAHLEHANHGAAFWALAADLNGGSPAAARAWLRDHGSALHWVGRAGL